MELSLTDFGGGNQAMVEVPETLFGRRLNEALLFQATRASLANGRLGTRAQKTRAQVHHSTKKIFRQKGTGRARGGHSSSPIRRGGGRAFPSSPDENFGCKVPRRLFRTAMAVILSQLVREQRFAVVRSLDISSPKTRDLLKTLTTMSLAGRKVLLVDVEQDDNLLLASRNMPTVNTLPFSFLLLTDLLNADGVVFSERALQRGVELWA